MKMLTFAQNAWKAYFTLRQKVPVLSNAQRNTQHSHTLIPNHSAPKTAILAFAYHAKLAVYLVSMEILPTVTSVSQNSIVSTIPSA